jgi:hypothetical protein
MKIKRILSILGVFAIIATMAAAIIPAIPVSADSVTLYWVGNGGNWTDTSHWATSSDGTPGHAEPGTTNPVIFDANSITSAGQSITLNDTGNCLCASLNMSTVTNSPTIIATYSLASWGNILIPAGVTFSGNPSINFYGSSGNIGIVPNINNGNVMLQAAGTFALTADLTGGTGSHLYISHFTCNTGGHAISVGYLQMGAAPTFNFSNSTITLSGANGWYNLSGSPTFTSTGSTIILNANTTFYGDGQTYAAVQFNGTGTTTIQGSNTFTSIALGGGASQIVKFTDSTTTTTGNLTDDSLAKNLQGTSTAGWTITKSGGGTVQLDNLTIAHSTATPASTWYYGYSSTVTTSSGWIYGSTGTGVGLTASTAAANTSITLNGFVSMGSETSLATEFEYGLTTSYGSTATVTGSPITLGGAVTANVMGLTIGTTYHYRITAVGNSTYHSSDGTFTTTGGAGSYWVNGSGNWSDAANHWASSSNGAPGAGNLPTSSINVYFDSNSFTAANQIVTINATSYCANMSWVGATNTPTLAFSGTNYLTFYGTTMTFISAMHVTGDMGVVAMAGFSFAPTSPLTITSAGQNLGNIRIVNYVTTTITFADTACFSGISYGVSDSFAINIRTNSQIIILFYNILTT